MMSAAFSSMASQDRPRVPLLSDESTIELVLKAKTGNSAAIEALLERCLPQLRRWAHGRLPASARGSMDTGDLVQVTVINVLARLDAFEPRHVGAMQAYLRQSVLNRIRDEVRKVARRPTSVELPEDLPSPLASPLESAISAETYARYRAGLAQLDPRDRELVLARIEAQWSFADIADRFGLPSADAARMAMSRTLRRLSHRLRHQSAS